MDDHYLIHKLFDIFEYKNEYQFQSSNIQPQDMYVLERIHFNRKIVVKDISKQYSIPPSTLTGIIDRLEKKELIERMRSNIDRRAIELITTEKGKSLVEQHVKEDKIFTDKFFGSLEADKSLSFKVLLKELLNNINKDTLFSSNKETNKEE